MYENKNERYLWCFSNVSYEIDRKFWKNGSTFTSLLQFIYLIKTVLKKRNSLCPFVQNRHKKILKYRLTFNNSNLLLRKSNTFNSLKNSACKKQKITKEKKNSPHFPRALRIPTCPYWLAGGGEEYRGDSLARGQDSTGWGYCFAYSKGRLLYVISRPVLAGCTRSKKSTNRRQLR